MGVESYLRDPGFDDSDGHAINAMKCLPCARHSRSGSRCSSTAVPTSSKKSVPPYPPMAKRILQDNGSWLGCLKKPNVDFVRTPIERIDATGIVTDDGEHYDADILCFATGFRHVEYLAPIEFTGRGGASLREQWGDEPTGRPRHHHAELPEPLLPLRAGHQPCARRQHHLPRLRVPDAPGNGNAIREVLQSGANLDRGARRRARDEYAARYVAEIGQMVWAHGSVEHSHYKNRNGKIFTLSPWPIETYWAWTCTVDPQEYVIR